MTIQRLYDRVQKLDTDQVIQDAIEETKDHIADLQAEQMHKGQESTGDMINPPYRFSTVAIKRKKGQPSDRVTLQDTGAFYKGLYVNVTSDSVRIDSTDSKTTKLVEKYGPDIFGLSVIFKREYLNESLRPLLASKIRQITGLKLGRDGL